MRVPRKVATFAVAGAFLVPVAAPPTAADASAPAARANAPSSQRALVEKHEGVRKQQDVRRTAAAVGLARDFGISTAAAQELLDSAYR